ncbi:hypothetical protein PRZ48_007889 [Zasmidium cellare]|uniref:Fe2OG dioxygenase domain-containing protein n=1 Tax=Zasmidium cellare TaxID=395010 RepID=A0ABR0ELS0_ZASCE|nr:hypothetical protein PRZ48_007889 [Zasmidium cellare]
MGVLGKATLNLQTIDLGRLESSDFDERQSLLQAFENQGFVYLDLSSNPQLVQDWENVLRFMADYFAKDMDEKMIDSRSSDNYGYEPMATSSGVENGKPDYYESLKASRDSLQWDHSKMVPIVADNQQLFKRFSLTADDALQTILRQLDIALSRSPAQSFQSWHSRDAACLSTLSMFRYPKQDSNDAGVGHGKHTDLGTLTFLLTTTPGLQVLTNMGWQYVAPKKNCAIINVGDTLRFLSGYKLRSAVHRVMPVDKYQREDRYSIAYFLRAADNTKLTDNSGRSVSAKAWHNEKFDVFRESHEEQAKRGILTGGMERGEALVY